ncbi:MULTISPECIES: hypothetical protein [Methylomonas]|jgi:hypothetical protein|uniref:CopG family transcriptional regulator n=1 Tax=Methylomonas koyamae TaxID=702114 RepID=A0A177NXQ2_9GAMM|nr:hypothetical protein [Methylomonas koyamae]OAI22816.1 CopG family transcriptional regulator [Methylomonas koyamae]
MNSTHQTEIPDQLWQQAQTLVQQGWAGNLQEIVTEALRRYLESHQQVLTETFIQDDVEWGLHGED